MKQQGKVAITLDRERNLRFDINAMCDFEDLRGRSAPEVLASPTISDLRAMLFVALRHEDEELTQKRVGELMTEFGLDGIKEKLLEAVRLGFQGPNPAKKKEPAAAALGTGAPSGASPSGL